MPSKILTKNKLMYVIYLNTHIQEDEVQEGGTISICVFVKKITKKVLFF